MLFTEHHLGVVTNVLFRVCIFHNKNHFYLIYFHKSFIIRVKIICYSIRFNKDEEISAKIWISILVFPTFSTRLEDWRLTVVCKWAHGTSKHTGCWGGSKGSCWRWEKHRMAQTGSSRIGKRLISCCKTCSEISSRIDGA